MTAAPCLFDLAAPSPRRREGRVMRAFVHRVLPTGRDALGTGRDGGMISPEYRNVVNLRRYFLEKLPPGIYHVEAFHNWDRRYGRPDMDFIWVVGSVTRAEGSAES